MQRNISSRDNAQVKNARALATKHTQRIQQGLFFAEGIRLCKDLASTHRVHSVFVAKDTLKRYQDLEMMADEVYVVNEPVAEKLAGTKNSQGLFCLFHTAQYTWEDLQVENGILVCDTIQDPANVGAMVRSAAGFGMGGVVLLGGCADPYAEKALRASMGSVGRIPILTDVDEEDFLQKVKEEKIHVIAAALDKEAVSYKKAKVESSFALLIGNEGAGISEYLLSEADEKVYIPMYNNVESLNAGVAAAVLMSELCTGKSDESEK